MKWHIPKVIPQLLAFLLPVSLLAGTRSIFSVGPVPFYLVECVALLLILRVALVKKGSLQVLWSVAKNQWRLLVIAGVVLIASTLRSPDLMGALGAVKAWFLLPLVVGAAVWLRPHLQKSLAAGVLWFAYLQIAIGVVLLDYQPEARLMGLYDSPNFMAMTLVVALGVALVQPLLVKRILSVTVLLTALLMTQSLGGFIAVGAMAVYGIVRSGSQKVRLGAALVLIVGVVLGSGLVAQRLQNPETSSFTAREQIWKTTDAILFETPQTFFLGVGLRGYEEAYGNTVGRVVGVPIQWAVPEPHNLYLAWYVNLGLAGMLLAIAVALRALWKKASTPLQKGYGIALIGLLAHGLVDTPFFLLELMWLWAILLTGILGKTD